VMVADVYANESHRGRGGWTWYTGSAGWTYQFIVDAMMGLKLQGNHLLFKPCFPLDWPSVSLVYRYKTARYKITIYQDTTGGEAFCSVDGVESKGNAIALVDDGKEHEVVVTA